VKIVLQPLDQLLSLTSQGKSPANPFKLVFWKSPTGPEKAALLYKEDGQVKRSYLRPGYVHELLAMMPSGKPLAPGEFKKIVFDRPMYVQEVDYVLRKGLSGADAAMQGANTGNGAPGEFRELSNRDAAMAGRISRRNFMQWTAAVGGNLSTAGRIASQALPESVKPISNELLASFFSSINEYFLEETINNPIVSEFFNRYIERDTTVLMEQKYRYSFEHSALYLLAIISENIPYLQHLPPAEQLDQFRGFFRQNPATESLRIFINQPLINQRIREAVNIELKYEPDKSKQKEDEIYDDYVGHEFNSFRWFFDGLAFLREHKQEILQNIRLDPYSPYDPDQVAAVFEKYYEGGIPAVLTDPLFNRFLREFYYPYTQEPFDYEKHEKIAQAWQPRFADLVLLPLYQLISTISKGHSPANPFELILWKPTAGDETAVLLHKEEGQVKRTFLRPEYVRELLAMMPSGQQLAPGESKRVVFDRPMGVLEVDYVLRKALIGGFDAAMAASSRVIFRKKKEQSQEDYDTLTLDSNNKVWTIKITWITGFKEGDLDTSLPNLGTFLKDEHRKNIKTLLWEGKIIKGILSPRRNRWMIILQNRKLIPINLGQVDKIEIVDEAPLEIKGPKAGQDAAMKAPKESPEADYTFSNGQSFKRKLILELFDELLRPMWETRNVLPSRMDKGIVLLDKFKDMLYALKGEDAKGDFDFTIDENSTTPSSFTIRITSPLIYAIPWLERKKAEVDKAMRSQEKLIKFDAAMNASVQEWVNGEIIRLDRYVDIRQFKDNLEYGIMKILQNKGVDDLGLRRAGVLLREYFKRRGWDNFNRYVVEAMVEKTIELKVFELEEQLASRMWVLAGGNLKDRLLVNWTYGIAHVLHLRGEYDAMHDDGVDSRLLSLTIQRFIKDLLNLPPEIGNQRLRLKYIENGEVKTTLSRYTYRQLMLWGLKFMLDPRVHDPNIHDFTVSIDDKYIKDMLTKDPMGQTYGPELIKEKLIPLLAEVFSMTDEDFRKLGLTSIWDQSGTESLFYPESRFSQGMSGFTHREPIFDIALPMITNGPKFISRRQELSNNSYMKYYYAKYKNPKAFQKEFFFRIFPGLEEQVRDRRQNIGLKLITIEDFNQEQVPLNVKDIKVDPELIARINRMQEILGEQIIISSGFRTPEYNEYLRGQGYNVADNSLHLLGRAADIELTEYLSHEQLVRAAHEVGLDVELTSLTPKHVHIELPTENSPTFVSEPKDDSMVVLDNKRHTRQGGIDFNSDKMNLQVKKIASSPSAPRNDTVEGIRFHIDPAMLQQLQNAPGFVPVIINIQPLTDLRRFLDNNL